MKLFFGIELDEQTKETIDMVVESLRQKYPYYRWIPKENYHLTLYHLGEVLEKKIPRIIERAEEALFEADATYVYPFGLDTFVIKQQLISHIRLERNTQLKQIRTKLNETFYDYKSSYKTFIPHITFARYKLPSKQQYFHYKKVLQRIAFDFEMKVDHVSLFQSRQTGGFPEYKVIGEIKLFDE